MLLFSTLLSINDTMQKDDFIALVITWNKESPHKENVIPDIEWNGERNVKYGNRDVWLQIEEHRNRNIIAVRYEKTEADGVVWDTDYVMNFDEMKLSIRLDRSYLEEALVINPAFSTPHFITLLIEGGYLKPDGGQPIARTPVLIDDSNICILADVINGQCTYHLPVVYISKTCQDEWPVQINRLASMLKGVAHVFVEKHQDMDEELCRLCNDHNEYNGAVGVYFPNKAYGHKKFLHHSYSGSDAVMMEKIIRTVIQYSNSQNIDALYTWGGVNNSILRDRYSRQQEELRAAETARQQTENETDALIQSVDDEIATLKKQLEKLTRENDALLYENQGIRTKLDRISALPVLYFGGEDEFFPGEIKDMLLKALRDALQKTEPHTRRADVLGDIINSNGGYQGIAEKKAKQLKDAMKGYKNLSSTMRQLLLDMGFEITDDGKHYKLKYYGDGRYWIPLAKTPSDNRSGMNVAMTIIKNML